MQRTKEPWFVVERSEALAAWLLTSRKDVRVKSEHQREDGVDLLVEVEIGEQFFPNLFVVQVKGTSTVDLSQWTGSLQQQFTTDTRTLSLPACLFVVNVKSNEAQYSWIAEPVVEGDIAELHFDSEGNFRPLNIQAVNDIVDKVRNWYAHLPQNAKSKGH
jgi:hypothetical protein